MDRQRKWACS